MNSQIKFNSMKKLTLGIMAGCMIFLFMPFQLKADSKTIQLQTDVTIVSKDATARVDRLNEIKAMDATKLNFSEKKELRKEVRAIQSEMKANGESTAAVSTGGGNGIYISAGAIIIILLLILIL
jgi:hypothetical protein